MLMAMLWCQPYWDGLLFRWTRQCNDKQVQAPQNDVRGGPIVPQRAVRLYTTSTTTRAVETTPEHYVYVFSPAPTIFAAHCELRLLLEKRRLTRRRMFLLLHGWRWLVFTMDILDVAHFEERVKSSWPLMRLWLSPRPWGLQLLAFLLTRSPQRADLWGVCSIRGMQWEDYAYEERSRCITCPCPFGRERGAKQRECWAMILKGVQLGPHWLQCQLLHVLDNTPLAAWCNLEMWPSSSNIHKQGGADRHRWHLVKREGYEKLGRTRWRE